MILKKSLLSFAGVFFFSNFALDMQKSTWRKWHKWLGIIFCFFMLMFSVSGIMLNHRDIFGNINISRGWLSEKFQFENWNNGLLRGSLSVSSDSVHSTFDIRHSTLIYGTGGVFVADSAGNNIEPFCDGMPESADARNIRAVVETPDSSVFAIAPYQLYRLDGQKWSLSDLGGEEVPRLTDMTVKGDSLIILSRSDVYVSLPPYNTFKKVSLKIPEDYDGNVSLFRTVLTIHSGEIFGMPGKIFMDLMALLIIFFCITGIIIWVQGFSQSSGAGGARFKVQGLKSCLKFSFKWHELLGRKTIILTGFVCLTGWMLRPPVLILLALTNTKPIPYSKLDSDNAWEDKLRMIKWDSQQKEWLLSTSQGFYTLPDFNATPKHLDHTPPVSVMGINVMEQKADGEWLIGSFSGMYKWNREKNKATDYFTGEPAPQKAGAPFGNIAVSGYSANLSRKPFITTWYEGTSEINQPEEFRSLPMSLWSLALEIHTGRIYTFMCGAEVLIYIFIAGIIALIILWSGWKIRKRKIITN